MTVESNSCLLWFCFSVLCDWLEKLAPLSQAIRSNTQVKPKPDLLARVLPRLTLFACSCLSSNWLIALFVSAVIGWSHCFGFGFTALN